MRWGGGRAGGRTGIAVDVAAEAGVVGLSAGEWVLGKDGRVGDGDDGGRVSPGWNHDGGRRRSPVFQVVVEMHHARERA